MSLQFAITWPQQEKITCVFLDWFVPHNVIVSSRECFLWQTGSHPPLPVVETHLSPAWDGPYFDLHQARLWKLGKFAQHWKGLNSDGTSSGSFDFEAELIAVEKWSDKTSHTLFSGHCHRSFLFRPHSCEGRWTIFSSIPKYLSTLKYSQTFFKDLGAKLVKEEEDRPSKMRAAQNSTRTTRRAIWALCMSMLQNRRTS